MRVCLKELDGGGEGGMPEGTGGGRVRVCLVTRGGRGKREVCLRGLGGSCVCVSMGTKGVKRGGFRGDWGWGMCMYVCGD